MFCEQYDVCPNRKYFSCQTQDVHPRLPHCVRISEEYHIHLARRHALNRSELLGLSKLEAYYVATAVSELANNLFFHADNGGMIQFYRIEKDGLSGLEVVAIDDGPGIICTDTAMVDGFSTNGGLGSGLGGTQRLMDEFEIESAHGAGTRITARKWLDESP